jgi:cell wall-associated NlpC family hydrolase
MRSAQIPAARARAALIAVAALFALVAPAAANAASGGVRTDPPETTGATSLKALLRQGRALAPLAAPPKVKSAIAAANRISDRPYRWGGGHGRWWDRGYDCSGAVSYVLHGAGLLGRPLDSGSLARWGKPGKGRWLTVYANGGHAFAVVAGLRWDTVGGPGPRWHRQPAGTARFVARHPVGL